MNSSCIGRSGSAVGAVLALATSCSSGVLADGSSPSPGTDSTADSEASPLDSALPIAVTAQPNFGDNTLGGAGGALSETPGAPGGASAGGAPPGGSSSDGDGGATGGTLAQGGGPPDAPPSAGGAGGSEAGGVSSGITSVPDSLPNVNTKQAVNTLYKPVKYLHVPKFDVHILGTAGIHDWTLVGASKMVSGILSTLKRDEDVQKFRNYHVFVITDDDPDVPGAVNTGHKNTGNESYMVITQGLICATAVGTLRPNNAPQWRAWDTPIHEFGHGIELGLGLLSTTIERYSSAPGFDESVQREYFAWTSQAWFDSEISRPGENFRMSLPAYRREYFATIFEESEIWRPTCEGRPAPGTSQESP